MLPSPQALAKTVAELTAPGKGILAADESVGTLEKRLKAVNVANTEEARRNYRELLFSTPGLGDFFSGVILFEETLKQKSAAGVPLPELLKAQGIVPGIKVDKGTVLLPEFPGESVTQGLDGLAQRLSEYKQLGARFAIPTPQAMRMHWRFTRPCRFIMFTNEQKKPGDNRTIASFVHVSFGSQFSFGSPICLQPQGRTTVAQIEVNKSAPAIGVAQTLGMSDRPRAAMDESESTSQKPHHKVSFLIFMTCGIWLIGLGLYFALLRPALLPEDPRYIGSSLAQIQSALPGLERWLRHFFIAPAVL